MQEDARKADALKDAAAILGLGPRSALRETCLTTLSSSTRIISTSHMYTWPGVRSSFSSSFMIQRCSQPGGKCAGRQRY